MIFADAHAIDTLLPSWTMEAPYDATTPAMRKRVKSLVSEAKEACRRPLFEEIANGLTMATTVEDRSSSVCKRTKLTNKSRNWEGVSIAHR